MFSFLSSWLGYSLAQEETQIPRLEVGNSWVNFLLPEYFDRQYTIEVEFWKSDGSANRNTISISSSQPNKNCPVAPGVGYLYRHRTLRDNRSTEWSHEEGFTPQRVAPITGRLKRRTPDIREKLKNIKRNILIVGTSGCGKSSFLNTLFRSYTESVTDTAKIYCNARTVTPRTTLYKLEDTRINIIDTAGIEKGDNEKMENVADLIRGRVENLEIDNIDIIVLVHAFKSSITSQDSYFKDCERLFDLLRTASKYLLNIPLIKY